MRVALIPLQSPTRSIRSAPTNGTGGANYFSFVLLLHIFEKGTCIIDVYDGHQSALKVVIPYGILMSVRVQIKNKAGTRAWLSFIFKLKLLQRIWVLLIVFFIFFLFKLHHVICMPVLNRLLRSPLHSYTHIEKSDFNAPPKNDFRFRFVTETEVRYSFYSKPMEGTDTK